MAVGRWKEGQQGDRKRKWKGRRAREKWELEGDGWEWELRDRSV